MSPAINTVLASQTSLSQGMEVEDQEGGESDNDDVSQKGADGQGLKAEEEDEEGKGSAGEEEQQETITVNEEEWYTCSEDEDDEKSVGSSSKSSFHNSSRLLHKDELLDLFKAVHNGPRCKEGQLTVGLVGKKSL